eukprot:UN11960
MTFSKRQTSQEARKDSLPLCGGLYGENALYRRFRIATINEFRLEETEVVLPYQKAEEKKKSKGFTAGDQERIALARRLRIT